ncbi:helix-turn-helix domain-containing protein [Cytobacillus dafuensis]|nr:helix-turn-helix domain-containing protein [Cytobacillus dafuensis]
MLEGNRVRLLRNEQKISLKELSEKSGVSVSMISQIERGNTDVTLTTLYKICKGLGVSISTLLFTKEETARIIKKKNRKTIVFPSSNTKYQLLTPNHDGSLEMILVELEPGQTDRKLVEHQGEECGVVLEGSLTVILGDEEFYLEEGDSIYFNSLTPHRFLNNSSNRSLSIWAMSKNV